MRHALNKENVAGSREAYSFSRVSRGTAASIVDISEHYAGISIQTKGTTLKINLSIKRRKTASCIIPVLESPKCSPSGNESLEPHAVVRVE